MSNEFSDNKLILIAMIIIAISAFNILVSFGKIGISGMSATSDVGFVNVTVPATTQITVYTKSINFTGTNPGDSKTSYAEADVDTNELRPCTSDNHCGLNITNDGSAFINITLQETENLFDSGTYSADANFLYNVTMQDALYDTAYGANGNCSVGYDQGLPGVGGVGYWRGVPRSSSEHGICYLNFTDTSADCTALHTGNTDTCPDVARVEFNITVPTDEPAGDKAGTITFTAVASV